MGRKHSILFAATCLILAVGSAAAAILSDGTDTRRAGLAPPAGPSAAPCSVLWFFGPPGPSDATRLSGLGLFITVTANPADLNAVNLANYDVLAIAYTRAGVIGSAQPVIQAYVASGHGLLIHQPSIDGSIDYAPAGFEVKILSTWWCGVVGGSGPFAATIVNGSHPITTGLTDADLGTAFPLVVHPAGDVRAARYLGQGQDALSVMWRDIPTAETIFLFRTFGPSRRTALR